MAQASDVVAPAEQSPLAPAEQSPLAPAEQSPLARSSSNSPRELTRTFAGHSRPPQPWLDKIIRTNVVLDVGVHPITTLREIMDLSYVDIFAHDADRLLVQLVSSRLDWHESAQSNNRILIPILSSTSPQIHPIDWHMARAFGSIRILARLTKWQASYSVDETPIRTVNNIFFILNNIVVSPLLGYRARWHRSWMPDLLIRNLHKSFGSLANNIFLDLERRLSRYQEPNDVFNILLHLYPHWWHYIAPEQVREWSPAFVHAYGSQLFRANLLRRDSYLRWFELFATIYEADNHRYSGIRCVPLERVFYYLSHPNLINSNDASLLCEWYALTCAQHLILIDGKNSMISVLEHIVVVQVSGFTICQFPSQSFYILQPNTTYTYQIPENVENKEMRGRVAVLTKDYKYWSTHL